MKVKSKMVCPVRQKDGTWTTVIKNLKKTYRISDEKNSFAINADDQIIRNVRKQFAKLGCIIKQRKGLRIKPRLLFLR